MYHAKGPTVIVFYLGITKVEVDGLGMSNVQDAIGFRRESGDDLGGGAIHGDLHTCTIFIFVTDYEK